jgi:Zn-dependent metalloprotease
VKRAPCGISALVSPLVIAALALCPLLVTPSATASLPTSAMVAAAPTNRPDLAFTPAERDEAIAHAKQQRGATASRLRLGSKEGLVVKDVLRDADGTLHTRYNRTYAGLPVIGGDLVVQQAPSGKMLVERASDDPITLPSTAAAVPGASARSTAARSTGLSAGSAAPVKVVYAARHTPVLAWQTVVAGIDKDGTPIRDLVYTDARTGKRLGRLPQVMDATGSGQSLYSGTVSLQTTLSGSTYQLTDTARGGHKTYDAGGSTSKTSTGRLAERCGRCRVRRREDLGLLQAALRPHGDPQRRCRGVLEGALRLELRERVLGRRVFLHDLRGW